MRRFAIRLLTLTIYAAAAMAIPVITATEGDASNRHLRKHHKRKNLGVNDAWATGGVRPVVRPAFQGGSVCPGSGRSFECKIWPPPYDEDPDRKASGTDGG
jgi:hypothetical protein